MSAKEIIYPFFLECIQYCTDGYWESIFEDLAYGKTVSGCYINKNFLCCSYKGKEFSYKIERKEPKVLYEDIHSLLTEKVGVLSQKEKVRKRLLFDELEKNNRLNMNNWGAIRKKHIKDILYHKFCIDSQKKYNLTIEQTKRLSALIMLAVVLKTITSKDIVYENGCIQSIKCLQFIKVGGVNCKGVEGEAEVKVRPSMLPLAREARTSASPPEGVVQRTPKGSASPPIYDFKLTSSIDVSNCSHEEENVKERVLYNSWKKYVGL
jgi:hypothetical protein